MNTKMVIAGALFVLVLILITILSPKYTSEAPEKLEKVNIVSLSPSPNSSASPTPTLSPIPTKISPR